MKDVDTVTPLDGDGSNATGVEEQFLDDNPAEDYETKGRTTVATRRGYRFVSSNPDLPVVTYTGVKMTKEEADSLVTEADGLVHIVNPTENEEE